MKNSIYFPKIKNNAVILNGPLVIEHQPLIVIIWSASCQTCMQQLQRLRLELAHSLSRCQLFYIHMPRTKADQQRATVAQAMAQHAILEPVILDEQLELTSALRIRFVPAVLFFDKEKKLRFSQQGTLSARFIRERIEKII